MLNVKCPLFTAQCSMLNDQCFKPRGHEVRGPQRMRPGCPGPGTPWRRESLWSRFLCEALGRCRQIPYRGSMSGSLLYTSRPAAATLPDFKAAISASSSTTAPRLALTTMAPSGSSAIARRWSMRRVCGDATQWSARKSQCGMRSSGVGWKIAPSSCPGGSLLRS